MLDENDVHPLKIATTAWYQRDRTFTSARPWYVATQSIGLAEYLPPGSNHNRDAHELAESTLRPRSCGHRLIAGLAVSLMAAALVVLS